MDETLDPKIKSLAHAIALTEGGGKVDYEAKGKSGENGAYQYMPNTWKGWAGEVLGDPEAPLTPENQNKVAYTKIKSWTDQGMSPAEIASKWNSGRSDAYLTQEKGVNRFGIKHDVQGYVKKVQENAAKIWEESQKKAPTEPQNAPEKPLVSQLGDRVNQATGYSTDANPAQPTGIKSIVSGFQKDETPGIADNIARVGMGVADVAGAAGGAIGDLLGKGVGWLDKKVFGGNIDKTAKQIFEVPEVKEAVTKYQDWAKENPEVSRQLGNAFNIFTGLIPAAKTINAVKNLASGGIAAEFSTYEGKALMNKAKEFGVNPIKEIKQAAYEMPDSWFREKLGWVGGKLDNSLTPGGSKPFHASFLKEPIDEMIKKETTIMKKAMGKTGTFKATKAAEQRIKGLKVVKEMIDELSKKPGIKGLGNKIPIVSKFTPAPKQGLISKALILKGSPSAKNLAVKNLGEAQILGSAQTSHPN